MRQKLKWNIVPISVDIYYIHKNVFEWYQKTLKLQFVVGLIIFWKTYLNKIGGTFLLLLIQGYFGSAGYDKLKYVSVLCLADTKMITEHNIVYIE